MGRSRDILLTLIVCLLAALCVMDLFNKKQTIKEKTNQTEPEQETVETLEKDDPLVTQLLDLISYDQTGYVLAQHSTVQFELVNQFPDDVKLMMAYLNANESDKTVLNTTTYDSSSMSFVYDNNDFTQVIQGGSYAIKSIPEDTMKRLVEEIFGDDSYHPANFAPNYGNYMTIFFYNPTRKEYVEYETSGGGMGRAITYEVESVTQTQDEIVIRINYDKSVEFDLVFKKKESNYYFYGIQGFI